jgi:hypothetical protein
MSTIISWSDNIFISNEYYKEPAVMSLKYCLPQGYLIAKVDEEFVIIGPDKRAYDLTIERIVHPQFITGDLVK